MLRIDNTLTWSGGNINLNSNSVAGSGTLRTALGGTFVASGDNTASIFASNFGGADTGGSALFENLGTFRKSGSAVNDLTTVSVAFNNAGSVEVQSGILSLNNGGTHSGSFDIAAGAELRFAGGTHTVTSAGPSGAGTLAVTTGTVNWNGVFGVAGLTQLSGGILSIADTGSTGTLTQSGGTLSGAGTLTVGGAAALSGGDQSGAGTTILQEASTITGSFGLDGGRLLRVENTLTWSGGNINLNSNSVAGSGTLRTALGGTFVASGDNTASISASNFGGADTGASALFENLGTFRKSGSTVGDLTTVSVVFNNAGSVEVQSGILSLSGGGTHSGTFNIAQDTELQLSGGTHTISGGSSSGAGTLAVTSGTVTSNSAFTVGSGFRQSGGTLSGAGTLTVGGVAALSGGDQSGVGTTILQGASTITGSFGLDGGRLLRIDNTLTWSGGNINLNSNSVAGSGTLRTALGGTFVASGDNTASIFASNFGGADTGGSALFENLGTFRKSGSAVNDLTTVSVAFNNAGSVEVQSGILSLSNGYTQTSGVTRVNNTTINSPMINLLAGRLEGSGMINATVNSAGIIDLDAGGIMGTLNTTGGAWNGLGSVSGLVTVSSGTFTIGSGANLRADGGLSVTGTGTIAATDASAKITGSVSYLSSSNSTFAGIIAGAGKTLTLNNPTTTLTLAGPSIYTGATTVTAGTLKAGVASVPGTSGAFGLNSAVTMANSASAILDITGFDTQIGSLSGGGTSGGNVTLGAATLTFGGNNTSPAVYSGTISGGGGISKFGLGTQTLSALNNYTGATTVGGGTLRLDFANLATPTNLLNSASALTLAGGTLSVLGKSGAGVITSQTMGDVTLNTGTFSTIAPDPNNSGAGSTTLTLGNNWTRESGATLLIDYSSASTGARLVATTGTVTGSGAAGPSGLFGYVLVKDSGGTGFATQDASFNLVRNTAPGTVLTPTNSTASTTAIDFTTVPTDPGYSGGTLTLDNVAHAANTLLINTTGGGTLNLGGPAGVLALTSNALLLQGTGDYAIQNGALGVSGSEVIVHQIGTGTLTITSPVSGGAGSLTKDGGGALTLSGVQNFATLNADAGTTNLPVALGTGGSTINANARTNITTSQTLAALNIGASGVVVLSASGPAPLFKDPTDAGMADDNFANFDAAKGSGNAELAGTKTFGENHAQFGDEQSAMPTGEAFVAPVPEPSGAALLFAGVAAIFGRRRRAAGA